MERSITDLKTLFFLTSNMNFFSHLWKNWKTTIFSAINLIAVFLLGKGLIDQPTMELIS